MSGCTVDSGRDALTRLLLRLADRFPRFFAVVIVNHGGRRLLGEKVVASVAAPEVVLPCDELVQIVIPVLARHGAVSQANEGVLPLYLRTWSEGTKSSCRVSPRRPKGSSSSSSAHQAQHKRVKGAAQRT